MEIITAVFDAVVGWIITTITNAIDLLWPTVNCDEWEHPADHYPGGTWPDGSPIPEGITAEAPITGRTLGTRGTSREGEAGQE